MKQKIFIWFLAVALVPVSVQAASSGYTNNSIVTSAPMVDATNFVNNGIFEVSASYFPYATAHTLNYVNNGYMYGSPGFEFDTGPSILGYRTRAASFFNGPQLLNSFGTVEAVGSPCYLFINATNIQNKGVLAISASGLMQLTGNDINISRSLLLARTAVSSGGGGFPATNTFIPDAGITDVWWGQTNMNVQLNLIDRAFTNLMQTTPVTNGTVTAPSHRVTEVGAVQGNVQFGLNLANPSESRADVVDGYYNLNDPDVDIGTVSITTTNADLTVNPPVDIPTNLLQQAVYIRSIDTNILISVTLYDSSIDTNGFKTVVVGFSETVSNEASGTLETSTLYFGDRLASERNRGLSKNTVSGNTYIPANYGISRSAFAPDTLENIYHSKPGTDFLLYNPPVVSNRVNAVYAGYSANINNLTSIPVNGNPTNAPGRIEIYGKSLDMTKTRIRGEGMISINVDQLVGSSNAVVDSENLSFRLGSTNGSLVVKDLIKPYVTRFTGDILAWSGTWNQQSRNILTNYAPAANSGTGTNAATTNSVYAPITNLVNIAQHVLILDASGLNFKTQKPVIVWDFVIHSTNVTVYDPVNVAQSLFFDSRSLTFFNNFTLTGSMLDWNAATAPNLLFFTNYLNLYIPGNASFGDDRSPYDTIANYGIIQSEAQAFGTTNLIIGNGAGYGLNYASGVLSVFAKMMRVNSGILESGGTMLLNADSMYLTNTTLYAGGLLRLNSKTSLMSGTVPNGSLTSVNFLQTGNGFELPVKPATSDLLGTTIESDAPQFFEIDHVWSGADRGPVKEGFSNNAAIGRLILTAEGTVSGVTEPLIYFTGTGASNAIYVDDLDLSQVTTFYDYHNVLGFNTNLTIYYAYSEGVPPEILNGEMGGHLRWVTNFTGPYSATSVMHDGTNLFPVNRGLVESMNIDSDGDGITNGLDASPFDAPFDVSTLKIKIQLSNQPGKQNLNDSSSYDISWFAAARGIYQVQYSTTFPPTWQPLVVYTNSATAQTVIITDKPPVGTSWRFYRVGLVGFSP